MSHGLAARIADALGIAVSDIRPLGGGCIGDVRAVTLSDGARLVAKTGSAGLSMEAVMLRYLADHACPVPKVVFSGDDLLLIDWIDNDGRLDGDAERHAADVIAALHSLRAPTFGFAHDTMIAGLHQPNPKMTDWRRFFSEHRLLYMANDALIHGTLDSNTMARIEVLAGRLETWIDNTAQPSLIHGDLWGGNILTKDGRLSGLIDPAIYYADAEIELAFSTLFSTFSARFFDRYQEHHPIAPGFFEARRDIYNLYPLLLHTRLFGSTYAERVKQTLGRFGC